MGGYRELRAWAEGIELALMVYQAVSRFPQTEQFELSRQLRCAAVSIPSNIAEGWGRRSRKAFAHHIDIALGSLCEVETQLVIAGRIGYLAPNELEPLTQRCALVNSLMRGLRKKLTA